MQPTMTTNTLLKLTAGALAIAIVALITLILPAEYNIDPTGIGNKLGLTKLATATQETNTAVSNGKTDPTLAKAVTETETETANDKVTITVPAYRGVEFKFAMQQHSKLTYEWFTEDEKMLYHDLHGEPEGDTTGYFESYTIATVNKANGSFTTPFAGSHGWYWKNTSDEPIKLTLITSGQYEVEGLKQ